MKSIRIFGLGLALIGAFAIVGCKGGGMKAGPIKVDPKAEACRASCDEAKTQCEEKCAEEVDADACKLACTAAKDKCVEDCKDA